METPSIDIKDGELDVYVDGELLLHIGQVSDNETINLFLYPSVKSSGIIESIMHEEDSSNECTHEILLQR